MRKLIANMALAIYFCILKGEKEMMAMLFACRVVDGRTESFDLVPAKLKAQVAEIIINDFNLPELVPVEYGGTAA